MSNPIDLSPIDIAPKGRIDEIKRFFQRPVLTVRVMWMALSGRHHYFRDMPSWFVFEWASLGEAVEAHTDTDLRAVTRAALREAELRVDRVRRQIEQQAGGTQ